MVCFWPVLNKGMNSFLFLLLLLLAFTICSCRQTLQKNTAGLFIKACVEYVLNAYVRTSRTNKKVGIWYSYLYAMNNTIILHPSAC